MPVGNVEAGVGVTVSPLGALVVNAYVYENALPTVAVSATPEVTVGVSVAKTSTVMLGELALATEPLTCLAVKVCEPSVSAVLLESPVVVTVTVVAPEATVPVAIAVVPLSS